MELQYFGANCVQIDVNKSLFLVDPSENAAVDSKKDVAKSHVLITGFYPIDSVVNPDKLTLSFPGEYEIDGAAIRGIQTPSHLDVHDSDTASNVAYTVRTSEVNLCVLGNPAARLNDDIMEQIGTVDVLVLPVGGGGLTLSPAEAAAMVKQIDPKLCIATHYNDGTTTYDMPQAAVTEFFEEMGSGEILPDKKLKVKIKDLGEEGLQVLALPL